MGLFYCVMLAHIYRVVVNDFPVVEEGNDDISGVSHHTNNLGFLHNLWYSQHNTNISHSCLCFKKFHLNVLFGSTNDVDRN